MLFPNPAAIRTTDRAAEDANSKGVEKLQRKKNSARFEAHQRKKIVKNVKKCDLQSRACLLALLVGENLFEAFHWGIEVMRKRESNNNTNLNGFAGGDANDIDGIATEKPRPSFVGDDLVKDFRERMAMVANHQMRADGL
jgi:hypothetical protein